MWVNFPLRPEDMLANVLLFFDERIRVYEVFALELFQILVELAHHGGLALLFLLDPNLL